MEIQPDDVKTAGTIMGSISAIAAAVVGAFKFNQAKKEALDAKFDSKADKEDVTKALTHIEKLYENAERDRKLMRDLHDEAMREVSNSTKLILTAVGSQR